MFIFGGSKAAVGTYIVDDCYVSIILSQLEEK